MRVEIKVPQLGDGISYEGDMFKIRSAGYQENGALVEAIVDFILGGDFAADTGWIKGDGWTIASDVAASDASQSADSDLTQTPAIALVEGSTYELTFTVANRTAGNVTGVVGGQEGTDRATNATFVENVVSGSGDDVDIRADLNFDGDVDDVEMVSAHLTWDMRAKQFATITLTGNRVIDNPAEHVAGAIYTLEVTQDATGSRLISWGSDFDFAGGTAPTLSTGAADIDVFRFQSNGTKLRMVDSTLDVS